MARILVLGGHGKIAMKMTQILAARNHAVTSIIRNPDHVDEIRALASKPQHINPVVASIEEADEDEAKKLMENIDWVVWAAGAGGKGGKERTKLVDEVAAKRFIAAAIASATPTKFLMISANCSRRSPASYWTEKDLETFKKSWEAIPDYCQAKTAADEFLWSESRKVVTKGGKKWQDICLRPGLLTDEPGTGKVDLGRAKTYPGVSRDDVAAVAVELLEQSDVENKNAAGLWIDLISGDESIGSAVDKVLINKSSSRE